MTLIELKRALINLLRELKNEHPQHRSRPIGVEKFICDEISAELLHNAVDELTSSGFIKLADNGGSRKNNLAYSMVYLS